MVRALRAWAINQRGKNLVRNLPYLPQTRLVRGIYFRGLFRFWSYANKKGDDVIGGSNKTVQHSIQSISAAIKAVFFKIGTRHVHHKRNKTTPATSLAPSLTTKIMALVQF